MSRRTRQRPNHLPLLHRQQSIEKGLVWWRIISDSVSLRQRKTGHIDLKLGTLRYVIARLRGLLAKLEAEPTFKSP